MVGFFGRIISGISISAALITVGFLVPQQGLADTQPLVIKNCVNGLLYTDIFENGRPAGPRTIISPGAAARACQGVTSRQQAEAVKLCVNGLLYTDIFENGRPAGPRTIISPEAAARACAICSNNDRRL
jgi:hypothetical protein